MLLNDFNALGCEVGFENARMVAEYQILDAVEFYVH